MSFEKLPFDSFQRVLAPKVLRAVNLHEATLGLSLDYFVITSSIIPLIGTATQAAYAATTSFVDSFARWRLSQGLTAQAFAFGLILEVGTVMNQPELRNRMKRNGLYATSEAEFRRLIEAAFIPQTLSKELDATPLAKANLVTGFEPGKFVEMFEQGLVFDYHWTADPRHGRLMQAIEDLVQLKPSEKKEGSTPDQLKNALSPGELKRLVTKMVVERLSKLLFMSANEIDPEHGMGHYGMDSMIAAELCNWLWKTFALEISFLELLSSQTKINDLVEKAMVIQDGTRE